jgi:hypothetical protein
LMMMSALGACSSSSSDPRPDGAVDMGGGDQPGSAPGLAGTVSDKLGVPVTSARIEAGGASVFSDTQGKYALTLPMGGSVVVKVTRNWFKPVEETVTVAATGTTQRDLTIEEMPLKIDPADLALAQSYARTFDWTKQPISIEVVARPTRRDFDNAVYFRNPALYRDTSKEPALSPMPRPEIGGGSAKNFTFKLNSGKNTGQEALDLATIVDALKDTPIAASAAAEFMVWTPMLTWLGEWDAGKAADLKAAGVAVRQQSWGGTATRPQDIERVYLDTASGALWVEVVFASFVQVGPGITDDDGDGRKEVYARVAGIHHSSDVIDKLSKEYGKTTFTTHGLSKEVTKSLNELYSTATAAQVERYVGQPIELPGVGMINYPFVVLKHAGGQKNVILVAP